jgi:hypothetical protein
MPEEIAVRIADKPLIFNRVLRGNTEPVNGIPDEGGDWCMDFDKSASGRMKIGNRYSETRAIFGEIPKGNAEIMTSGSVETIVQQKL